MRPFFSTPLFRLLTVIINCSLAFTTVGFAFSPTTSRYQSTGQFDSTDSLTSKIRAAQIKSWKKLGIALDGEKELNKPLNRNFKEQQNPSNQKTDIQKIESINNKNQSNNGENTLTPENDSPTLPKSQDTNSTIEKNNQKKPTNKKSYSAVKNLPDAEKIRTTPAQVPKIPAPIPSTACLISTVNCPSDKNREVTEINNQTNDAKSEKLLSSFLETKSKNSFSFEKLLAFNKTNQTFAVNNSLVQAKRNRSASDVSTTPSFFKNTEIYDPNSVNLYSTTGSSSALLLPPGGNGKIFDFDGDNKADIGVWRPDTGAWYIFRSSDAVITVQANFGMGSSGDRIVPANYDGDTKTDYAYWQPSTGVWTIKQSSYNQIVTYTLGQSGDIPVQGDYDGDGKSDAAVYRPSNGTWYYRKSSDGTTVSQVWGNSTDVPVIGDFDGDNKTDFTIVRPSDSNWWILQSSTGSGVIQWGSVGDRLVPGDYDGDGKTDVAVWRASDNTWYVRKSSTGTLQSYNWGLVADYPVPADYDGDNKTDYAIWRSSGDWWIIKSSDNSNYTLNLGISTDIPIPSSYVNYFSASNQTPTAEAGGPYNAALNTAIQFDGRASTDSDGQIYGYNWSFGDGAIGTGSRPSHIYSSTGTFTVSLTVTDNQGTVSSADTATVTVIDATNARLDPFNAVGGDNIISKNFSWGMGLAGLSGRNGMVAGVSLSYNSLVWLKQTSGANNYMIFDPDNGFPGPGFRFGMPIIEKRHFNSQTGKYGYLLITESGSRVEFRQVGSSSIYETADSSYTQLIDSGSSLLVRTTDGTQHNYQLIGSEFQCVEVKDRNGNYITVEYNSFNRLSQITDTLGRVLVVNYDENGNPISVAQSHSSGQRVYVTFSYELKPINTNYSGMTVIGPANGSQITVLKYVALDDGSYYQFNYNSYGQVYQIDSHAADNHKLNHVKYNLEAPGSQTDCPRYTQREDYAENWMTVTTQISAPSSASWTMPDTNQSESGLMSKITTPDGTEQRIYYHNTSWDKAIPTLTETWGATNPGNSLIRQRWVTTHLTQDNTSVSYIQNPRVTASAVGDAGNIRKSSVSYETFTLPSGTVMNLPNDSFEYSSDGTTVYRHTQTDHNFDAEYINRYIIGLPSETRLYAGSGTSSLQARISFGYDEYSENPLTNLPNIIRHDTTNYGTGFGWRGNLTSTKRWNVINNSEFTINRIGYTIAGTTAWTQDPVQTSATRMSISYLDNFSDSVNRNTYAYPTTVTDPLGYTATSKYIYLSGLVSEVQGPKAGQLSNNVRGVISKNSHDSIDRVVKIETLSSNGVPTGAYTRYEYMPSQVEFKTFNKIAPAFSEAYKLNISDGHGRTRAIVAELPGSTGGFSGQTFQYNNMGRRWKESKSSETDAQGNPSGWNTTGDDATVGWLYMTSVFDWKGRILEAINTDGTKKTASYNGCGCAGGMAITVKDEIERTNKVYYDLFGRVNKTELIGTFSGSSGSEVYKTTVNKYNVKDQIVNGKIYWRTPETDESCPTGTCQESTIEYDGYGRIWKTHLPEQRDSNNNWKFIEITYNSDDTIYQKKDERGVIRTNTYSFSKQLEQISFNQVQGIMDFGPVTYEYDAVGNLIEMDDPNTTANYTYDEFARMQSESRLFKSLNQTYTRNYSYNASGMLVGITAPEASNLNVTYTLDKVGRLIAVNGGGYGNLAQNQPVISNMQYRAFGSLKQANYGNGTQATMQYNNRSQPINYRLNNTSNNQILFGKDYYYTTATDTINDGKIKHSIHYDDTVSTTEKEKNNRYYTYDDFGRLKTAYSGELSCYSFGCGYRSGPFQQEYGYDVFGSLSMINDKDFGFNTPGGGPGCYGCPRSFSYSETRVNNRTTFSGFSTNDPAGGQSITTFAYDNDGRLINRNGELYSYDVAGNQRFIDKTSTDPDVSYDYDGYGELIKWSENNQTKNYYFRSTLLGVTLLELNSSGAVEKSFIYSPTKAKLATLKDNEVTLNHQDPAGENIYTIKMDKTAVSKTVLDPLGRTPNITYPGSVCTPPFCYGPNGNTGAYGGFDGLSRLADRVIQDRARERRFWGIDVPAVTGIRVTFPHDGNTGVRDFAPDQWMEAFANYLVTYGAQITPIYGYVTQPMDIYDFTTNAPPARVESEKEKWVKSTLDWLDNNKDCEDFINGFINQLFKDAGLDKEANQDLRYFINQFLESGTLASSQSFDGNANGNGLYNNKYNERQKTPYLEPGWGFVFRYLTSNTVGAQADNALTFIGELIHAIGVPSDYTRVGGELGIIVLPAITPFSDEFAAQTLYKMGYGISYDIYEKGMIEAYRARGQETFKSRVKTFDDGTEMLWSGHSDYWHPLLAYKCGTLDYIPRSSVDFKPR